MCSVSCLEAVRKAAAAVGIGEERIFVLDGEVHGLLSLGTLVKSGKEFEVQIEAWRVPDGRGNGDVTALLCFSSGTTGLPKAVSV